MQELLQSGKGTNIDHRKRIQQSAIRINCPGYFKVAPEVDIKDQTLWTCSISVHYDINVLMIT